MRISSILTLAAIVLTLGTSALAQEDKLAEAKAAFKQGRTLYEQKRYAEAAASFRKANELSPNWKLLYNIGQCEALSKRHGLALEAFEAYLSQGGDDIPDDRKELVLSDVARMRLMVGLIKVKAPRGSAIVVDGVKRGTAPMPGHIPVAASVNHNVVAVLEGEELPEQTVKVIGGQSALIEFKDPKAVEPAPVAGPVPEQRAEPDQPEPAIETADEEEGRSPLKIGGWVTLGVGAAMLLTGTITGGVALSKNGEIEDNCPDGCYSDYHDEMDSRDSLALATDVLLGVGAGAAAAGAVILIVAYRREAKEESVALVPTVDSRSAGISLEWRF